MKVKNLLKASVLLVLAGLAYWGSFIAWMIPNSPGYTALSVLLALAGASAFCGALILGLLATSDKGHSNFEIATASGSLENDVALQVATDNLIVLAAASVASTNVM